MSLIVCIKRENIQRYNKTLYSINSFFIQLASGGHPQLVYLTAYRFNRTNATLTSLTIRF